MNFLPTEIKFDSPTLHIDFQKINMYSEFHKYGYKVIDFIGKGSNSNVFRVQNNETSINYAAKVVDLSYFDNEASLSVIQEIYITQNLCHNNIVQFKEFFFIMNSLYLCIIQEYCDGGDLFSFINNFKECGESISESQIIIWLKQIVEALEYIHSKNIIHRDLKPSNIFLDKDYNIKIGDFGISMFADDSEVFSSSHEDEIFGTTQYMSPEILNEKLYSTKSDIWSLGCVMYEMVTLENIFWDGSRDFFVQKIKNDAHINRTASYSADLMQLILLLLSKNSYNRPSAQMLRNSISLK